MRARTLSLALFTIASTAMAQPTASTPYTLYVSSESGDVVSRIEVGPNGWHKVREVSVKLIANELSGPHNVAVSPDGRFWYVSIAHGTPYGAVWKYTTGSDSLVGRVKVGMFPTTIGLSPDGDWAYVPNSDFHGDRGHENTLSVIYTPDLASLTEIRACDMPHGSKWNHAGTRVYVACMMSDELLTIDPGAFSVSARVALGSGTPMSNAEHMKMETREDSMMMMAAAAKPKPKVGAASSTMTGQNPDCLTTYVSVAPNDSLIYLACNHSNELQVRDANTLALVRRLPTGAGAYNVEPSPDGRLVVVTNKKDKSVSVFDTRTWTETKRIPTSKRIPHGIAFSPDGRYAFVTCESVGTDPGAIDAIDLSTLTVVASMPLALQPTGVAVWRGSASAP
jgi:YVTN family beta-propeller protein